MKSLLRAAWILALCLSSWGLLMGQGNVRIQTRIVPAQNADDLSLRSASERIENILAKALLKEFPDLTTYTTGDMQALIGYYRMQALMGSEAVEGENSSKVQTMLESCRWLVNTTITPMGKDELSLNLLCLPLTQEWGNPLSNQIRLQTMTSMSQGAADTEKLANDFVKAFAYFEPEPYKGEIKLTVNEKGQDREEIKTPVYCNGADQTYHRTEDRRVESSDIWTFQKNYRRFVYDADCRFHHLDIREFVEEDPCHLCPAGRQGALVTTTKSREESSGEGIRNDLKPSNPDPTILPYHNCTHIRIRFLPNGTFTIYLQAVSKDGKGTYHTETKAEGSCGSSHPAPIDKEITPSRCLDHTFGPFAGSPMDKQLKVDATVTLPLEFLKQGTKTAHLQLDLIRQ